MRFGAVLALISALGSISQAEQECERFVAGLRSVSTKNSKDQSNKSEIESEKRVLEGLR